MEEMCCSCTMRTVAWPKILSRPSLSLFTKTTIGDSTDAEEKLHESWLPKTSADTTVQPKFVSEMLYEDEMHQG